VCVKTENGTEKINQFLNSFEFWIKNKNRVKDGMENTMGEDEKDEI